MGCCVGRGRAVLLGCCVGRGRAGGAIVRTGGMELLLLLLPCRAGRSGGGISAYFLGGGAIIRFAGMELVLLAGRVAAAAKIRSLRCCSAFRSSIRLAS